jgi:hypothetical protein
VIPQNQHILFLDIETVPICDRFDKLPEHLKEHWKHKSGLLYKDQEKDATESFMEKAGIFAEFGKIICISAGRIRQEESGPVLYIKSYFGYDEKQLLESFTESLEKQNQQYHRSLLCAHNGKEFDFPYICRRLMVNQLSIPHLLQIMGKKPWEIPHIDTLEWWKFGDRRTFAGLALLADLLGIPTPKDDIDGSQVASCYYNGELNRIVQYCQKDVITLVKLYLRMTEQQIDYLEIREITN